MFRFLRNDKQSGYNIVVLFVFDEKKPDREIRLFILINT